MSGLIVEQTGPQALIQDAGRYGVRHLGVTQGGALDWVSLGWANWLLGNKPAVAGLEIAVGGLTLRAESHARLALAGADLGARLDGEPLPLNASFLIEPGQRLSFAHPVRGLRAYLAVPGGIVAEPILGSIATVVREGLGGIGGMGRALARGDRITWPGTAVESGNAGTRTLAPDALLPATDTPWLEMVVGAQIGHFSGSSLYAAFNSEWTMDTRADRMGIRLRGPELHCRLTSMISEGIPLGAVQVPADGQPIVLLNDRQTIGGYPRLGALTPLSCARLAQCMPGEAVRLRPVTPGQASQRHKQQLNAWR